MRLIERRIGLLFAGFLLLFSITMARAVWLQGVRGGELGAEAQLQQTKSIPVPGHRGTILDRNGEQLAVSEDAATVFATPYQVKNPTQTAARLAPVLGVDEAQLRGALENRSSGFAYLRRQVPLTVANKVRALRLAGIGTSPDVLRAYPQGQLAAQVIGAVGVDNQGLSGIEESDDKVLHGVNGERQVVKDARGQTLKLETIKQAHNGRDVQLTIDSAIQAKTEEVLAGVGDRYHPKDATAIVMDPRTGDVLALANWPAVDANDIAASTPDELQNHATGLNYEPGSTFKAFTVAAALSEHLVTPSTVFGLAPTIQVADRVINESHARGSVSLSVAQILAQSSNIGAITIGLKVGAQRFDQWIRRFGFGKPTGVAFPGEQRGIVPSLDQYSGSTMGNLPIGQGISVTPMQMAAAYSAIANGGILRPPRLVERVGRRRTPEPKGRPVITPTVSRELRIMLEGVLAPGGTASEVSVPGYVLAGKTGTAQIAVNGGYSESKFVASFVGFAPASNPQLLAAVIVDQPQGDIYGGSVAAPAFGEIAHFALPYLRIAPH